LLSNRTARKDRAQAIDDLGESCSGALFYKPLQSQEHALILLAKLGDDEELCHFQQALDARREIAIGSEAR